MRKDKQATEEERESQRHFFFDIGVEHCILAKLPPLPGMQGGECRRRKKDNAVKSLKGPEQGDMSVEASIVLGPAAYAISYPFYDFPGDTDLQLPASSLMSHCVPQPTPNQD